MAGSTASEPGPRGKVRSAVRPQPPSRQIQVSAEIVVPVRAVDHRPARLAAAVGPRLPEPRRDRDDAARRSGADDLELVALGDGGLVDVTAEDQLRSRADQGSEHVVAVCDGLLSRAPRRADELVVEHGDAQRARCGFVQLEGRPAEATLVDAAGLMAPGPHRVDAHDVQPSGAVGRLDRLPGSFELLPGRGEPGGQRVRDVVVSRDHQHRCAEPAEDAGCLCVLVTPTAMCQIAARNHERGRDPADQFTQRALEHVVVPGPDVEVQTWRMLVCTGEAGYTVTEMADEQSTEIFDDLYLGLRAGGALRKQRRGEPLTADEEEALGRWQRLSTWRKGIAIGGFAVGTFGLGFTLGGLIFGRWRKA